MTGRNHYHDNPKVSVGNIWLTVAFWVQWVKSISGWPFCLALWVKCSNCPFMLWRLHGVLIGKNIYHLCLYMTFSSFKHVQGKVTETSNRICIYFFLFSPRMVLFCFLGHPKLFLSVDVPIIFGCPILSIAQVMKAINIWQWVADDAHGGICRQFTMGSFPQPPPFLCCLYGRIQSSPWCR